MTTPKGPEAIRCARCGERTPRRGKNSRYCPACAEIQSRERGRKWASEHPLTNEQQAQRLIRVKARTAVLVERGIHREQRRSITWMADDPPSLQWSVRVAFPFTMAFSKNHVWSMKRGANTMFLFQETKDARAALIERLEEALGDQPVFRNRLWVDLLVRKPDHRSDAVNFIDQICDAIKEAVKLDDTWFSIRRLDWEISKSDPVFYIGFGQEEPWDLYACSYCGRLLLPESFTKNRSTKSGLSRTCLDCSRISQRVAKQTQPALPE